MSGPARQWWPEDWIDEVSPPSRPTPDDWLIDADGHYYIGYRLDATDVREHEKRYFERALQVGDIVQFVCCDDLGDVEVTIQPDGTFEAHGLIDPRATHFWTRGDADTLAPSLAEFCRQYAAAAKEFGDDLPERIALATAWWSESIPHKLVAFVPDRGPSVGVRFEQVSQAEAKQ